LQVNDHERSKSAQRNKTNNLIINIMRNIDFKNFNLQGLKSHYTDINLRFENSTRTKADNLTISECFLIPHISKGVENLYFDIVVYNADDKNDQTQHVIKGSTKDNIQGVKELLIELIKQS